MSPRVGLVLGVAAMAALVGVVLLMARQGHAGLDVPAGVVATMDAGGRCWLETDRPGQASWYCTGPGRDTCDAPCVVRLPANTQEDEFGVDYGWQGSTPVVGVWRKGRARPTTKEVTR